MPILQMQTEAVQTTAQQLVQASALLDERTTTLRGQVSALQSEWTGSASMQFSLEMEPLIRNFAINSELAHRLSQKVEHEVAEWEEVARVFGNSYVNAGMAATIPATFALGAAKPDFISPLPGRIWNTVVDIGETLSGTSFVQNSKQIAASKFRNLYPALGIFGGTLIDGFASLESEGWVQSFTTAFASSITAFAITKGATFAVAAAGLYLTGAALAFMGVAATLPAVGTVAITLAIGYSVTLLAGSIYASVTGDPNLLNTINNLDIAHHTGKWADALWNKLFPATPQYCYAGN